VQQATTNGQVAYRNGDWGPAYLLEHDGASIGVVALRPGDAMDNHIHERCHESFLVIEGELTLWTNRSVRTVLQVGDIASCEPFEEHHVRNGADVPCRLVFMKTPPSPGDTIVLPWTPPDAGPAPTAQQQDGAPAAAP
jgi:quercetin dioxygenase-like cupin family protein